MKTLADRIKGLRLARGLTIAQAVKELQMSPSTLYKYELWMVRPKLDILCRIIKFYDVTSDYLLGLND